VPTTHSMMVVYVICGKAKAATVTAGKCQVVSRSCHGCSCSVKYRVGRLFSNPSKFFPPAASTLRTIWCRLNFLVITRTWCLGFRMATWIPDFLWRIQFIFKYNTISVVYRFASIWRRLLVLIILGYVPIIIDITNFKLPLPSRSYYFIFCGYLPIYMPSACAYQL